MLLKWFDMYISNLLQIFDRDCNQTFGLPVWPRGRSVIGSFCSFSDTERDLWFVCPKLCQGSRLTIRDSTLAAKSRCNTMSSVKLAAGRRHLAGYGTVESWQDASHFVPLGDALTNLNGQKCVTLQIGSYTIRLGFQFRLRFLNPMDSGLRNQ